MCPVPAARVCVLFNFVGAVKSKKINLSSSTPCTFQFFRPVNFCHKSPAGLKPLTPNHCQRNWCSNNSPFLNMRIFSSDQLHWEASLNQNANIICQKASRDLKKSKLSQNKFWSCRSCWVFGQLIQRMPSWHCPHPPPSEEWTSSIKRFGLAGGGASCYIIAS